MKKKKDELEIEFLSEMRITRDPECLHCEILAAMVEFAAKTNGNMELHHAMHSLLQVIHQLISNIPEKDDKKEMEEFLIERFNEMGFNWMRIEGGKQ